MFNTFLAVSLTPVSGAASPILTTPTSRVADNTFWQQSARETNGVQLSNITLTTVSGCVPQDHSTVPALSVEVVELADGLEALAGKTADADMPPMWMQPPLASHH